MAAFERYYVPGVSASVDANDTEIGLTTPPYDGTLEADWMNAGTNSRLQFVDASMVSWNTAALGTTSRRLDLTSWVREGTSDAMSSDVPASLTVTEIGLGFDGENAVASVDATSLNLYAGIRQQASGGIYSPSVGGATQFIDDNNNLISSDPGTFPFSFEKTPVQSLAGLSEADIVTVLRSSSMVVRLYLFNTTSSTFVFYFDRIRLRVTGTTSDTSTDTLRTRFAWRDRVR